MDQRTQTPVRALEEREIATVASGVRIMALRALADADAAADVAQETMLRLLDAVAKGRLLEGAPLGPFARGIARHVIADQMRRDAKHEELRDETMVAVTADPLQALIMQHDCERVKSAMSGLSEDDRETLRLTFVENLSSAEVASRLGDPPERIRKRKSRALERLRQLFLGGSGHDMPPEANVSSGQRRSLRLVEDTW